MNIGMQHTEIEPQMRRNLLKVAEAYCKATGYKLSHVSRQAHSDSLFLDGLVKTERTYQRMGNRLGKQGSFTARVYDKMILWFAKNWPPDATVEFPTLDDLTHTPKGTQDGSTTRKQELQEWAEKAPAQEDGTGEGTASGILAKLRRNVSE